MRILHAISGPVAGGAEIYVKDLAIEQRRQGDEVHIAFLAGALETGRSPAFQREFLDHLDAHEIPHFVVGHECRKNPLKGALRVRRYCKRTGIELYHSHLKFALAYGALLALPHVYTHHSILPGAPRWLFRLANIIVDAYVGISNACTTMLSQVTGRPVTTILNAIDTRKMKASVRHGPSGGPLECLAVGRLLPPKNYALLVDAVALLSDSERERVRVRIAGEGSPEATRALQQKIDGLGLGSTITLLGNRSDIAELMGGSHLLLMSSAWEGLPIVLLEACASGLPFIATDVGSCSEVAKTSGSGIIVPPQDPVQFANALRRFFGEPALLETLSGKAVANREAFAISRSAEGHRDLYRRLMGKA
jgi:glycosyltransferase involved in cell wall biosynthesis